MDGSASSGPIDLRAAIERCLRQKNYTEAQLARAIGVDQSAVWRARRMPSQRRGAARRKICSYMQQEGYLGLPDEAVDALEQLWDGSEAHARALAGIILATKDLRPERGEEFE